MSLINIDILSNYKNSLRDEENKFNSNIYGTFLNGYISHCQAGIVNNMKNNLQNKYESIKNKYNNINNNFEAYLNNAQGLEEALSSNGANRITESSLRNKCYSLPSLDTFKVSLNFFKPVNSEEYISFNADSSITPPKTYTTKAGDNLWNIAQKNNVIPEILARYNHLEDPNLIAIGQKLIIPSATEIAKIITAEDLANDVIRGSWGSGEERKNNLTQAGFNYEVIQEIVNQMVKGTYKKEDYKSVDFRIEKEINSKVSDTKKVNPTPKYYQQTFGSQEVNAKVFNNFKNIYSPKENSQALSEVTNTPLTKDLQSLLSKYSFVNTLKDKFQKINPKTTSNPLEINIGEYYPKNYSKYVDSAFLNNNYNVNNMKVKALNRVVTPAIKEANNAGSGVLDCFKRCLATVGTGVASIVEGIGQFGEAIIDAGATVGSYLAVGTNVVLGKAVSLYQAIDKNYQGATEEDILKENEKIKEKTKAFVSKEYVTSAFDKLYEETKIGQGMKNSYFFDQVRNIGNGIGYNGAIIGLSILTCGAAGVTGAVGASNVMTASSIALSGTAGVGRGSEQAWNSNATYNEGIVAGLATGSWESLQYYLGMKINNISAFLPKNTGNILTKATDLMPNLKQKALNSLAKVALDTVDSGIEGFVQPAIQTIYADGYMDEVGEYHEFNKNSGIKEIINNYKEVFEDNGGWMGVLTNASVGLLMSAVGEGFDLKKYRQEYSKLVDIDKQILLANNATNNGLDYTINIDKLSDIPDYLLDQINNHDKITFQTSDGQVYDFATIDRKIGKDNIINDVISDAEETVVDSASEKIMDDVDSQIGEDIYNLNEFTIDDLRKFDKNANFSLEDGNVVSYEEALDILANKEVVSMLKSTAYGSELENVTRINEAIDKITESTTTKIKDAFNKKFKPLKAIKTVVMSPLIGAMENLSKCDLLEVNALKNAELKEKVLKEGIVHFTDLDSAQKILESNYIKSSSLSSSYSLKNKKSYFFGGNPSYEQVISNLNSASLKEKMLGIKINVDEKDLIDFNCRPYFDDALSYYGDYHFDPKKAQLAYYGLKEENGKLLYKEISKTEYDNYHIDIPIDKFNRIGNNLKHMVNTFNTELDFTVKGLKKLYDTYIKANVENVNAKVSNGFNSLVTKIADNKIDNTMQDIKAVNSDGDITSLYEEIIKNGQNFKTLKNTNAQIGKIKSILSDIVNNKTFNKTNAYISEIKSSKVLTNMNDVAIYFNDPKQFLYSRLDKLKSIYQDDLKVSSIIKKWESNWNVYSVNEIDSEKFIKDIKPYLNKDDKKILNALIKNSQNLPKLSAVENMAIEDYTYQSGPAICSYLRQAITTFRGHKYDFTDINQINKALNKSLKRVGNNKFDLAQAGYFNYKDLENYFDIVEPLTKVDYFVNTMKNIINSSPALENDLVVYRGVSDLFFDGEKLNSLAIGSRFNDKAFSSCSIFPKGITSENNYLLEIELPKGTKAAYIEKNTGIHKYGQQELLLDTDSCFEITSLPEVRKVKKPNGDEIEQIVIKAKLVDPNNSSTQSIPKSIIKEYGLDNLKDTNLNAKYYQKVGKAKMKNIKQYDLKDIMATLKENNLEDRFEQEILDMHSKHLYDFDVPEHNRDHAERVLFYSMFLGKKANLTDKEMDLLIEASKYHDAGRNGQNHALKGSEIMKNSVDRTKYSQDDINKIAAIIELHEPNFTPDALDKICSNNNINRQDIVKLGELASYLKDADAIDRVRFPNNLDTQYLINSEANSLVKASYQMQERRGSIELRSKINEGKISPQAVIGVEFLQSYGIPDAIINFIIKYPNTGTSIYLKDQISKYLGFNFFEKIVFP